MKSTLLSLAITCLASPALALSCLAPDVASSFQQAADAKETYVIVHGTLEFDAAALPKTDLNQQDQNPPDAEIPAQLRGKSLSKDGFVTEFDRPITLRALCFGPWCGKPVADTEYLAFVEKTDSGHVLSISPCGDFDFAEPDARALETVTQCFQGGACQPADN